MIYGIDIKEYGDMKAGNWWIISVLTAVLILGGCGAKNDNTDINVTSENETIVSEEESIEEETYSSLCVTEESEETMETADDRIAKLYDAVQKIIDETDPEYFKRPDYFGTTLFTEDKFEEIKQYEMNIVLEYLGLRIWNRPTSSEDEAGLPVDDPLGLYSPEKLLEYTDEEHDITVEYFCGGSDLCNLNNRYIAMIIKEYKNGQVDTLYYRIIDYGYLGVMTGDNRHCYNVNGLLENTDIEIIERGYLGDCKKMWLDEDAKEVNLIYDIGVGEREAQNDGTYMYYTQCIWVTVEETESGYKVKEIVPIRRR